MATKTATASYLAILMQTALWQIAKFRASLSYSAACLFNWLAVYFALCFPRLIGRRRLHFLRQHFRHCYAHFGSGKDAHALHLLSSLHTPCSRPGDLRIAFRGWSFHPSTKRRWEAVVLCVGDEVIAATTKRIRRRDVSRAYGRGVPNCGFSLGVDPANVPANTGFAVYALYRDGLAIPTKRKESAFKSFAAEPHDHPRYIIWGGKQYSPLPQRRWGYIDHYSFAPDSLSFNELLALLNNEVGFEHSAFAETIIQQVILDSFLNGTYHNDIQIHRALHRSASLGAIPAIIRAINISEAASMGLLSVVENKPLDKNTSSQPPLNASCSPDPAIRRIFVCACGEEALDKDSAEFSLPQVFPTRLGGNCKVIAVPRLKKTLITLQNATIWSRALVMSDNKYLVLDPSAHPSLRVIAGIPRTLCFSKRSPDFCALMAHPTRNSTLEEGILLDGRSSFNYFHWLVEYLPRLHTLEALYSLRDIPLIANARMHNNMKQMLSIVAPDRTVFWNDEDTAVSVRRLHYPSMLTFIPDDATISPHASAYLPAHELLWLRDKLLRSHSVISPTKRRLYISRLSEQARTVVNEQAIREVFLERGFEVVNPAELSLSEQITLFRSAEAIAGNAGAAFANLLFCNSGTKVIMTVMRANQNYSFFASLAALNGCELLLVTGSSLRARCVYHTAEDYLHAPYWVSPRRVSRALDYLGL